MSITQPTTTSVGDDLSEKKVFTLVFTLNSIVITDEPDFPQNFFAVLTFIGKSYRIDFKQRVSQIGCEDLVIETTEDDFKSKISTTPLLIEVVKLIDNEEFNYCKAEVMYSDKLIEERFCVKEVDLIQAEATVGSASICLGIQTEEMRIKNDPCILAVHSPSFKELLKTLFAEYCIDPTATDSASNCKLDALRPRKPKRNDHPSMESFKWCKESNSSLDIPHELTCQELFGSDASKFCGCGQRDPKTCKPVRPYSCGADRHYPGCWDRNKKHENMSNEDMKKSVSEIIQNVCREFNVNPCPGNSLEPGCTCKPNKAPCALKSDRSNAGCKNSPQEDYKDIIKNMYNDSMRNAKNKPAPSVPSNILDMCQERKPEFDLDALLRTTTRNLEENLCNMSSGKRLQKKAKRCPKEKDNPHLTQIMHQLNGIKNLIKECCEQDCMQQPAKIRKTRGRRTIKSGPTRTASLVKNPCANSKTKIEQRKKARANQYAYNFGNRNTGIVLGHKHCKDDCPLVPKNMGWLWNINTYGIDKMRPGWRPGAVLKCIKEYLCEYLQPCERPVCPPKEEFFNFKYEHIDGGPTVPRKPRNCAKIGTLKCNLHDKNVNTDVVTTDSLIDFKNAKQICETEDTSKDKKTGKKGKGKKGKGGKDVKGGAANEGPAGAQTEPPPIGPGAREGTPGAPPGGLPGGVLGGVSGRPLGGAPDKPKGGVTTGVPNGVPGAIPGGVPSGVPGSIPSSKVRDPCDDPCADSCCRLRGQNGQNNGGVYGGGQYGEPGGGQLGGPGGGQYGGPGGGQYGGPGGGQFGGPGSGQYGGSGGPVVGSNFPGQGGQVVNGVANGPGGKRNGGKNGSKVPIRTSNAAARAIQK